MDDAHTRRGIKGGSDQNMNKTPDSFHMSHPYIGDSLLLVCRRCLRSTAGTLLLWSIRPFVRPNEYLRWIGQENLIVHLQIDGESEGRGQTRMLANHQLDNEWEAANIQNEAHPNKISSK